MITIGGGHFEDCFRPHTPKIARSHISETYIGQDKSIQILLPRSQYTPAFRITHSADSVRVNTSHFSYLLGDEI